MCPGGGQGGGRGRIGAAAPALGKCEHGEGVRCHDDGNVTNVLLADEDLGIPNFCGCDVMMGILHLNFVAENMCQHLVDERR